MLPKVKLVIIFYKNQFKKIKSYITDIIFGIRNWKLVLAERKEQRRQAKQVKQAKELELKKEKT